MILIFATKASYETIRDDIRVTPSIDGSTPVLLQEEPAMAGDGTRCCIEHAFDEATSDWLRAYTSGENPAVIVADALPADWYTKPEGP